jgi:anthranilate synthase
VDPAGQAGQRRTESVTRGGVRVARTEEAFSEPEVDRVCALVDGRRGGVLSSGMEYPGRYSRWHLAYVNPCAEIVARGRVITARALNARGEVVLPVLGAALRRAGRGAEGAGPRREVTVMIPEPAGLMAEEDRSKRPTVFSAVREVMDAFAGTDPHLGLYGAFGYDLAFQFEPVTPRRERPASQRDLVLHLPDELYVVDRKRETAIRYTYEFAVDGASTAGLPRDTPPAGAASDRAPGAERRRAQSGGGRRTGAGAEPGRAQSAGAGAERGGGEGRARGRERQSAVAGKALPENLPARPEPGSYARTVERARERFARGDLFEVVPSQAFRAPCASAAAFYQLLRQRNPAPYEFFFNLGEGECLVGASPEMYVRVTGDRVETCPIAGTIRRGADPLEDAENLRSLLNSAKDESELTMCTDVDRNDKSRVCVPGSVRVIGRRQIEMYSRLMHTVDHIEGRLRPGFDALDAFLTHMWAVTVTGAPKTWAMQFIEDHEQAPRRWYGGAVGMIGFDGGMNTGLTLRTAHIERGVATVRAGATLLFDSDPAAEEQETELKARALLETLAEAATQNSASCGPTTPQAAERINATTTPALPGNGIRVLLVDHQDSFVHTLAGYFREQGATVLTLRAGLPASAIDDYGPGLVVLSPGPGRPSDFACDQLLGELDARGLPVFGVCLGLQALVEHAGGELTLLPEPAHGKAGRIARLPGRDGLLGGGLLDGLPAEFTAARYHSLHAVPAQVKGDFVVTAVTPDGAVMAIEDDAAGRWAVQFHPESILTAAGGTGHQVIANVLRLCRAHQRVAAGTP